MYNCTLLWTIGTVTLNLKPASLKSIEEAGKQIKLIQTVVSFIDRLKLLKIYSATFWLLTARKMMTINTNITSQLLQLIIEKLPIPIIHMYMHIYMYRCTLTPCMSTYSRKSCLLSSSRADTSFCRAPMSMGGPWLRNKQQQIKTEILNTEPLDLMHSMLYIFPANPHKNAQTSIVVQEGYFQKSQKVYHWTCSTS